MRMRVVLPDRKRLLVCERCGFVHFSGPKLVAGCLVIDAGRVLRALASDPEIFANMLAMHVGSISPADFLMHGILPLGRQLLTAS